MTATIDNFEQHQADSLPTDDAAREFMLASWRALHPDARVLHCTQLPTDDRRPVFRLSTMGFAVGVIAKRCSARTAGSEKFAYEQLLPRIGVQPRLGFFGVVPDEHPGMAWVFMEDAGTDRYAYESESCRNIAGTWLGRFHVAGNRMGWIPGLPVRDVRWLADQLQACTGRLISVAQQIAMDGCQREHLANMAHELGRANSLIPRIEAECAKAPVTVTHGDFAPRNIRLRQQGGEPTLAVYDWPDAAWGPPAVDLVVSSHTTATDTASPDAEAYALAVAPVWPGVTPDAVRRMARIGEIFWHVLAARMDADSLNDDYIDRPLSHLGDYVQGIADAAAALNWESQ